MDFNEAARFAAFRPERCNSAAAGRPEVTEMVLYSEDDHILTNDNYLQIFVELIKFAVDKQNKLL